MLRTCQRCGNEFDARPNEVARGYANYCSHSCSATGRKFPCRIPLERRFWAKVDGKENPDGCWIWKGGVGSRGYGQPTVDGKSLRAHRVSWELANGPIPNGLRVLHNCPDGDNPLCVNPAHLFLGTDRDNTIDAYRKGRMRGRPGESHPLHRLTAAQVAEIRARRSTGETPRSVATRFGVTVNHVREIVLGKKWRCLMAVADGVLRRET